MGTNLSLAVNMAAQNTSMSFAFTLAEVGMVEGDAVTLVLPGFSWAAESDPNWAEFQSGGAYSSAYTSGGISGGTENEPTGSAVSVVALGCGGAKFRAMVVNALSSVSFQIITGGVPKDTRCTLTAPVGTPPTAQAVDMQFRTVEVTYKSPLEVCGVPHTGIPAQSIESSSDVRSVIDVISDNIDASCSSEQRGGVFEIPEGKHTPLNTVTISQGCNVTLTSSSKATIIAPGEHTHSNM